MAGQEQAGGEGGNTAILESLASQVMPLVNIIRTSNDAMAQSTAIEGLASQFQNLMPQGLMKFVTPHVKSLFGQLFFKKIMELEQTAGIPEIFNAFKDAAREAGEAMGAAHDILESASSGHDHAMGSAISTHDSHQGGGIEV